jgi:hypothetical protein
MRQSRSEQRPSAAAAARHRIDVLGMRPLLGLMVGHQLAIAAAQGQHLDPAAVAHEVAGSHTDQDAANVVAAIALAAYEALKPGLPLPPATSPESVICAHQHKSRCVA